MTDFVLTLHAYNVYLLLMAATVTGIWGLVLFFMKRIANQAWRTTLIITSVLAGLQGLLGVTLVALGQKPGTGTGLYYLHYVYGSIVALGIPVAVTYTTGKDKRRDLLIFSIAALIMVAAGIRALMTGPGPQ